VDGVPDQRVRRALREPEHEQRCVEAALAAHARLRTGRRGTLPSAPRRAGACAAARPARR
jgi:hypothetical protein